MLSKILKSKILVYTVILFSVSSCYKNDIENQITIKITSIDSKTKLPRIKMYDTIIVRKEGIGYLKKTYNKVGEYITDSMGSVTIKISPNEDYRFMLIRKGFYGSKSFAKPFTNEKLNNGQEISIEAISLENR